MTLNKKKYFLSGKRTIMNLCFSLFTILAYFSVYISPAYFWLAGLLSLSLPILFIMHFLIIVYWLFINYPKASISLLTIGLGYSFLGISIALNTETKTDKKIFKVLSYNVRAFNAYSQTAKKNAVDNPSLEMINWLIHDDSDIKCVQEFYNLEKSDVYNTIRQIAVGAGYNFYVNSIENIRKETGFFGVAIFTKYPIIRAGDIPFSKKSHQKGIFADLKIGKDTVRVFNVHLRSMSIDEEKLFNQKTTKDESNQYSDLFFRLKNGFEARAEQVEILAAYISKSPYRVILCADLNDIPFSYTYAELKKYLHNSFEKAGYGFGFTYNGRLFFLRIDNQFYSKGLKAVGFETLRDCKYSDHFPVKTSYTLE